MLEEDENKEQVCPYPNTLIEPAKTLIKPGNSFQECVKKVFPNLDLNEFTLESMERLVNKPWQACQGQNVFHGEWLPPVRMALIKTAKTKVIRSRRLWCSILRLALNETENSSNVPQCSCCDKTSNDCTLQVNNCQHRYCIPCLRTYMHELIEEKKCQTISCLVEKCPVELNSQLIRNCLRKKDYNRYLEASLESMIGGNNSGMVKCTNSKCNTVMEMVSPRNIKIPSVITEQDENGKTLSEDAYRHFMKWRIRCRKCQTNFCGSCKADPYHKGYTCETFKSYSAAAHCRYCEEELPRKSTNRKNSIFSDICADEECQDKLKLACKYRHACGHSCGGVANEKQHLACLHENCAEKNGLAEDIAEELCNICWVEGLSAAPTIKLECGHFFHFKCCVDKIETGWPGTRITFGFLNCPLCKKQMQHPSLGPVMTEKMRYYDFIISKAQTRLKVEGMLNDKKLIDPNSRFYKKPLDYAMASFAYYKCFKCRKPYFGGKRDCEQNAAADNTPPQEFICFDCSDLPTIKCKDKSHKEYHLWKCRFCCGLAVWFCFGTTHFCEPCHKDNPMEKTRRARSGFKQCKGKKHCPLGVEHSPNGKEPECEFNLGCGMCHNDHARKHDKQVKSYEEKELKKKSVRELKKILKSRNIDGRKMLEKKEIIAAIIKDQW